MTETRFAFGRNWADYAGTVGEAELGAAEAGLRRLLPDDFDPDGHTLLDIGSGSGLHAVAAVRLGFERVTATAVVRCRGEGGRVSRRHPER